MTNINESYNGGIDLANDLYAFIDESGDDGFDFSNIGVSKWFNVSALVSTPNESNQMIKAIEDFNNTRKSKRPITKMSAKELKHPQKKSLFITLNHYNFITIHSLFL